MCSQGQQTRSRIVVDGGKYCPPLKETRMFQPKKCDSHAQCVKATGECKCNSGYKEITTGL